MLDESAGTPGGSTVHFSGDTPPVDNMEGEAVFRAHPRRPRREGHAVRSGKSREFDFAEARKTDGNTALLPAGRRAALDWSGRARR